MSFYFFIFEWGLYFYLQAQIKLISVRSLL